MNLKSKTKMFCAAAVLLATSAAQAGVVFSNAATNTTGDCSFSTTCAASVGRGNDYAAQQFSLASNTMLTSGSFTAYVQNGSLQPSAVNWMFLSSTGGLPGTTLASGTSTISSRTSVGDNFGYDLVEEGFNLPGVNLGAGTYYFALQAVSSDFNVYLGKGVLNSGAAETFNGGATWQYGYEGFASIATSLSADAAPVPEPATVALLGLGLIGMARSRRKSAK